jgi:stage III sporulation protein AB
MVKILGCLLIIGGCTIGGFIYGDNLKIRVAQLNELERSIIQLKNEIIYTYTTLPDAFVNVSQKCSEPTSKLYDDASKLLVSNSVDSVYEAFELSIENNKDKLCLKNEDIKIILDLTKNLGDSDINGQVSIFELTLINIKKQINKAEELMKKNLKIYRYLGFMFGAVIVIIIV